MSKSKRIKKDATVTCSTCDKILTNERHIKCLKCPHFYQCLQCLSIGSESEAHSYEHDFFVIEPNIDQIYCEDWDAHDEILLLFGIKMFGLGNWNDISNFIKTKSAIECKEHYLGVYLNSPYHPFPRPSLIPPIPIPPPPPYETRPVESCPSVAHEKHMTAKNKKERTTPAEYNGYMPYRHEFEVEWNNDAELLVSKIEFKSDKETIHSFSEKINLLLCYNQQLAERRFKTKTIEDWDIQNKEIKSNLKNEKDDPRILGALTESEKIVDSKIVSLAPYYGQAKMQQFVSCIHKRLGYQDSIKKTLLLMKNGVKTHSEEKVFSKFWRCVKDGKIPPYEYEHWNQLVSELSHSKESFASKNDELLSQPERNLCQVNHIHPQLYTALKGTLMNAVAIRQKKLTKAEALRIDPTHTREIGHVYDLLKSLGMLH